MPVSPMFQKNYKRISEEPFYKNGKLYVTMEHLNTGNRRDARWYSDAEYAKSYGTKVNDLEDTLHDEEHMKKIRGFSNGPILVIRNNRPDDEDWLRDSVARYAVGIGWYIVSTDKFPDNAPSHFKYLLLGWNEFWDSKNNQMHTPTEVASLLSAKARNREYVNMAC